MSDEVTKLQRELDRIMAERTELLAACAKKNSQLNVLHRERETLIKALGLRELATVEGYSGSFEGLEEAARLDAEAAALLKQVESVRTVNAADLVHDSQALSMRMLVRAKKAEARLEALLAEIPAYCEHDIGCPEWYRQHGRDQNGNEPPGTVGKPCDCGLEALLKPTAPKESP